MKLIIIYFLIAFFIVNGVENAPAIHPIHVRTIPLHPVTPKPTSEKTAFTTIDSSKHSGWHSSSSTQSTDLASSSSSTPSTTTTDNHSSWWNNQNSIGQICLRIFFYAFLIFLLSKCIEKTCSSKKPKKQDNNDNPVAVENKMYVSTINGQREESPPAYAQIHKS